VRAQVALHALKLGEAMNEGARGGGEVAILFDGITEAVAWSALPRPVAQLLGNRQALRVVRDRLGKVPQRLVRVPEVPVRPALPCPVHKRTVDRTRQVRGRRTAGAAALVPCGTRRCRPDEFVGALKVQEVEALSTLCACSIY
jgi:hypothetical protein